jgi:hypothetical protein
MVDWAVLLNSPLNSSGRIELGSGSDRGWDPLMQLLCKETVARVWNQSGENVLDLQQSLFGQASMTTSCPSYNPWAGPAVAVGLAERLRIFPQAASNGRPSQS